MTAPIGSHAHDKGLPGQEGARCAGHDRGGHCDHGPYDGVHPIRVGHVLIVDTEPVNDLCMGEEIGKAHVLSRPRPEEFRPLEEADMRRMMPTSGRASSSEVVRLWRRHG